VPTARRLVTRHRWRHVWLWRHTHDITIFVAFGNSRTRINYPCGSFQSTRKWDHYVKYEQFQLLEKKYFARPHSGRKWKNVEDMFSRLDTIPECNGSAIS